MASSGAQLQSRWGSMRGLLSQTKKQSSGRYPTTNHQAVKRLLLTKGILAMSNSRNLRFFLSTLAAALMVLAWTGASRADLTLSWSEASPAQPGSTLAGTVNF